MLVAGLFQGGQGVLLPPPPWKLAFPICYMGIAPLGFVFAPLKFAAVHLPPLERNPEMNPSSGLI